ncbi:hypothetical protein ABK249_14000 [Neorhizobium sp. Rsf11]|uniref:Uncharacterized protein n=2 Tax=Neorhizobium TaxID=1525371 RepID=A0ABV0M2F6_9HYPH|nr:hypothetical protein [Neorhizobium petrolearium]MCC2612130.1 hypothetical protein [Neorhizobium petrolearium]WGI67283.1 hypothetical protein QEO92_20065 [Neorhizobium petrolearium]
MNRVADGICAIGFQIRNAAFGGPPACRQNADTPASQTIENLAPMNEAQSVMLTAASRIFCIDNGAVHFSLFFGQVHKKPCRWFGRQAREDVIDGPATISFLTNGVPRCHIRYAILLKDGKRPERSLRSSIFGNLACRTSRVLCVLSQWLRVMAR